MSNRNGSHRRGLAIGCGGTVGAAWIVAALAAARDVLDWDPRTADVMIGTSAGAEMLTMLGSGIGVDELIAMQRGTSTNPILTAHMRCEPPRFPPLPRPRLNAPARAARELLARPGNGHALLTAGSGLLPRGSGDASWLQRLADRLNPGRTWVEHPATWLVAMDDATGERVAFGSPDAPTASLGAALRASWGVPGWFPAVPIDGRNFIDGGAASTASADLLIPARLDEVLVIAPMASTGRVPATSAGHVLERQMRNRMSEKLDTEIAQLRASGTKVLRLDATAEDLAVMGPNFMDGRRRLATFEHSLTSTRKAMEQGVFA